MEWPDGIDDTSCLSIVTEARENLLTVLDACIDSVGPCDAIVSTWAIGAAHADRLAEWMDSGRIRSLRLLLGPRTIYIDKPAVAMRRAVMACEKLGAIVVVAHSHAKWFSVRGDSSQVACMSSGNLNRNYCVEQFDLFFSPDACNMLDEVFSLVASASETGVSVKDRRHLSKWMPNVKFAPVKASHSSPTPTKIPAFGPMVPSNASTRDVYDNMLLVAMQGYVEETVEEEIVTSPDGLKTKTVRSKSKRCGPQKWAFDLVAKDLRSRSDPSPAPDPIIAPMTAGDTVRAHFRQMMESRIRKDVDAKNP
jgi:hypothetical protein